jgi:hypothetical protein
MPFFAAVDAPPSPDSMKFPVNSLLAGNLASETSSLVTPSSSGESRAKLTFGRSSRGAAAGAASEAIIGIRTRIRPFRPAPRGLILCPAERQPKVRRFFAYLADGAAEECRRLRRGVAGFDALAQVNDIHLGPFPAGVGSFHPPGSLVALGPLKPQCNVYASAVRYLPLAWHDQRTILGFG